MPSRPKRKVGSLVQRTWSCHGCHARAQACNRTRCTAVLLLRKTLQTVLRTSLEWLVTNLCARRCKPSVLAAFYFYASSHFVATALPVLFVWLRDAAFHTKPLNMLTSRETLVTLCMMIDYINIDIFLPLSAAETGCVHLHVLNEAPGDTLVRWTCHACRQSNPEAMPWRKESRAESCNSRMTTDWQLEQWRKGRWMSSTKTLMASSVQQLQRLQSSIADQGCKNSSAALA